MKYPRRAGQRGAIMVEALLVIAMQTAILGSALFVASAYTRKQASQQARAEREQQAAGRFNAQLWSPPDTLPASRLEPRFD